MIRSIFVSLVISCMVASAPATLFACGAADAAGAGGAAGRGAAAAGQDGAKKAADQGGVKKDAAKVAATPAAARKVESPGAKKANANETASLVGGTVGAVARGFLDPIGTAVDVARRVMPGSGS